MRDKRERKEKERKERERERKGRSIIEEGQSNDTMRRDSYAHSSRCRAASYSHSLFIELRPRIRRIAHFSNVYYVPKVSKLDKSADHLSRSRLLCKI